MSQSGYLTFYSESRPQNPEEILLRLLDHLQPEGIQFVSRTTREETGWRDYLEDRDPYYYADLPQPIDRAAIVNYYKDPLCLLIGTYGGPLAHLVYAGAETIPPEIRKAFIPGNSTPIYFGFHDLWENAEEDDGHFIARPFVSVQFQSYGTPNDWPAYRRLIFQVPEVIAAKRSLESVLGPLEQCIYWSV